MNLFHAGQSAPSRRRLPRSVAYALAAYILGLGLFSAVTPTPLYRAYGELWQLSPLTITLIYATYALGVLAALLLAGSLSDDVGRRPVLLASLTALLASSLVFVFASSVGWLFVARGLQGLATGAAISAASAALLDLHPRRDALGAGLANGIASSVGIALGVLSASALVQYGHAPLVLPYVVLAGLVAVAIVGAFWMPEPVVVRRRLRLKLERPQVPVAVRGPFLLAALTTVSSWSLGGLFFSLGPALAARLLDTADPVLTGIGIVALAGTAAVSQLVFGRTPPWLSAGLGSAGLTLGVVLIVFSVVAGSGVLYLVGSAVAGAGFGVGFLGGLRSLVGAIPATDRASVMSAFYLVAYASLSVPALLAGLVVGRVGLLATFEGFGIIVIGLALASAVLAWRARPGTGGLRGIAADTL